MSVAVWLEKHRSCANGCGAPVAFYDEIHYALKHAGCCSAECEAALAARSEADCMQATSSGMPTAPGFYFYEDANTPRVRVQVVAYGPLLMARFEDEEGEALCDVMEMSGRFEPAP